MSGYDDAMKLLALFLTLFVAPGAVAQSADWSLKKVDVLGNSPSGQEVALEFVAKVHAGPEALSLDYWGSGEGHGYVRIQVDVFAEDETALAQLPGTRPATDASMTVQPGHWSTFLASSGATFIIPRSGWYVARGKLRAVSTGNRILEIPLRELRFRVDLPARKEPAKNPT